MSGNGTTDIRRVGRNLNAFTFSFAENLLDDIRSMYRSTVSAVLSAPQMRPAFDGGQHVKSTIDSPQYKFFVTSYGAAPLLWVSNNCPQTYLVFKQFFDALGLAEQAKPLVDHRAAIVMYCGFFVVDLTCCPPSKAGRICGWEVVPPH